MKKLLSLAAICCIILSCSQQGEPNQPKRIVTFDLLGISQEIMKAPARATEEYAPKEAKLSDLWIMEGTELLAHLDSNSVYFENPAIELTYGEHTLTFIASGQTGQQVNSGIYSADKANETYGAVHSLNVSSTTEQQAVVLERVCYGVKWQSTDVVPANTATIRMTIAEHTTKLTVGLMGGTTALQTWNYPAASVIGKVFNVTAYGFPEAPNTECDVTTTITLLDASNQVISTKSKTVPVRSNRRTVISGALVGGEANAALRVNTDWLTDYETAL